VRLTRNLLENACRHASSTVDVSLAVVGSTVRLAISDDGPGVPAAARERIFERFVRVDDARSRQLAGTGLGLSIVAAVAARHGGSVRLLDGDGDGDGAGATFVLVLPADSGPI
jgi:signal transduction histidine kinase